MFWPWVILKLWLGVVSWRFLCLLSDSCKKKKSADCTAFKCRVTINTVGPYIFRFWIWIQPTLDGKYSEKHCVCTQHLQASYLLLFFPKQSSETSIVRNLEMT
jgi:hypothetical protein